MKYILKILVLLFSLSVFAQQPPRQMDSERGKRPNNRMQVKKALTPEQEATLWTKKMTLELDLNKNQQDQMYALILGKTKKIKLRMENKPKERPSKEEIYNMHISRLDEAIAMKESLKKILNDDQFAQWELMKNKKSSKTKDIKKRSKMKKKKRR
ncbi:MAG: hypothetical protein CMB96_05665 [Flavobacteriaceae bacterium]|nr:hypothetical protein [Flavobacteriaceae bacterium]